MQYILTVLGVWLIAFLIAWVMWLFHIRTNQQRKETHTLVQSKSEPPPDPPAAPPAILVVDNQKKIDKPKAYRLPPAA